MIQGSQDKSMHYLVVVSFRHVKYFRRLGYTGLCPLEDNFRLGNHLICVFTLVSRE